MKGRLKVIFLLIAIIGVIIISPNLSFSQRYPERPIEIVIPTVAGAIPDITCRILATELEKILNTKIIHINKPGASGVVAADSVIRGKKDGYTLLYAQTALLVTAPVINPEVVNYNVESDLEPLGFHFFLPHTITVGADFPWKTFNEFIDYAKKNPGKIRISTHGVGSTPHFIVEALQIITGAKFTHVPFKGGEAVITAVLGGHVEATCDGLMKVKPHVDAGKMRMLLITNKMSDYPTIPTLEELGYKESLPGAWFAVYAPSGIPEDVKKVLVPAIEKAIKITKPKIDQMGNYCEYKSPSELKELWKEDFRKIKEVAIKIGLIKK